MEASQRRALRDMVCRGLLLMLDRAGQIELPAVKFVPHNPLVRRARTAMGFGARQEFPSSARLE